MPDIFDPAPTPPQVINVADGIRVLDAVVTATDPLMCRIGTADKSVAVEGAGMREEGERGLVLRYGTRIVWLGGATSPEAIRSELDAIPGIAGDVSALTDELADAMAEAVAARADAVAAHGLASEATTTAQDAHNAAVDAHDAATAASTAAGDAQDAAVIAAQAAIDAAGIGQAAQESIDNLQIGGRNLLPRFTDPRWVLWGNSETPDDYTLFNSGERRQSTNGQIVLPVEPHTDYTLTVNSDRGRTNMYGWLPDSGTTGGAIFNFITGTFSRTINTGENSHVRIMLGRYSQELEDITFWNLKLEKGNKATDWTPAPEDQAAATAAAQAAADAAAADAIAKAAAAESAAKAHADAVAEAERLAAIAAASDDATAKANAAQAAAAATAAADAEAKANAALEAAKLDATNKADAAAAIANSKADVLIQPDAPAVEMQKATTLWIDTKDGENTPKRWDGSDWAVVTDKAAIDAAADAVAAQEAADLAQDAAEAAQTAAEAAQTTANAAQTAASNAQTTATNALTSANGRNSRVTSTGTPSGSTNPDTGLAWVDGDTWWQWDSPITRNVMGAWVRRDGDWVAEKIGHETIASVDVNTLLVTGSARMAQAVVDRIIGDAGHFGLLTADRLSIIGAIRPDHFAEDTSESISSEITSATDELGSSLSSEFTESIDSLPFSDYTPMATFETRTGDIDTAISAVEQAAAADLGAARTELGDQIESINTTLAENRLYIDINPTDGIRLGHIDNSLNVQITNDRLSFLEGNTEVAYISNQKLYITTAEVTSQLVITRPELTSSFYFDPRDNGNLSFRFRSN